MMVDLTQLVFYSLLEPLLSPRAPGVVVGEDYRRVRLVQVNGLVDLIGMRADSRRAVVAQVVFL